MGIVLTDQIVAALAELSTASRLYELRIGDDEDTSLLVEAFLAEDALQGPEFISAVTLAWAAKRCIRIDSIQPGQPQQNAYVERYNRTVRYDWLAHHLFETLDEIQEFATKWLWTYNHDRPNMALGGITPKQKLALAA